MPVTINGNNNPTAGGAAYGNGTELAFTAAGTSGQVLTSAGASAPTWSAIPATNLATGVTGTLPIANGGTGQTTANAALNALLPAQAAQSGKYLKTDGTDASWDQLNISTADITGTLPVGNGGTGAATLTANNVLLGNGTSALQTVAPGSSGNVLTSNGTTWESTTPAPGVSLSANNTWTGTQTFTGATNKLAIVLTNAAEVINLGISPVSGTMDFDITDQSVMYFTSNASGNWTINFRGNGTTTLNSIMPTGRSVTVAFLTTQGGTAYYNTSVQVDGNSITPKWQGGSAPTSGNANSVDVYTYVIVKTGSGTFTIFASQTKFA
jgi:hypothetical protein